MPVSSLEQLLRDIEAPINNPDATNVIPIINYYIITYSGHLNKYI